MHEIRSIPNMRSCDNASITRIGSCDGVSMLCKEYKLDELSILH